MKRLLLIFFSLFHCVAILQGQQTDTLVLSFKEYLGYVKKYHPIAKQANLTLAIGQANLLKARGGFDPKIEADYERKKFKGIEYWDRLDATFKIPTWYGVELKGGFEQIDGVFINPDETLPEEGLYSAGVSVSLARGLWINERMATLKKAKFFREQTKADRDILINEILFESSLAYFDWLQAYNSNIIHKNFLSNAQARYTGIRKRAIAGDIAAIDTLEAKITVQNRALSYEQAKVVLMKKALKLSNYLWLNDNIPIELQPNVIPDTTIRESINETLEISGKTLDSFTVENHPKLESIGFKINQLQVDKKFKANKLLPRIDLEYNFLTETPGQINSFDTQEYKGGLNFLFPLFLRKERGDLKLAKYKLQEVEFEFDNTQVQIRNAILSIYRELDSFEIQNQLISEIVLNYERLLAAEERKFSFGESSVFLINSRELKLIDAELKQNETQNKYFKAKAKLFKSLALNPKNLLVQ